MSYNAIETSFCAAFISLVQPDGYLQEIKKRPSVLKYTDRVKNDQAYLWQTINYFCTNSSQDLRHYQPIIYRFACGFQKVFYLDILPGSKSPKLFWKEKTIPLSLIHSKPNNLIS